MYLITPSSEVFLNGRALGAEGDDENRDLSVPASLQSCVFTALTFALVQNLTEQN